MPEVIGAIVESVRGAKEQYRTQWQQVRLVSAYAIMPHLKRKIRNPNDLFSLPWDNEVRKAKDVPRETVEDKLRQIKLNDLIHGKPK